MTRVQRVASLILMLSVSSVGFVAWQLDKRRQEAPAEQVLYIRSPRAVKFFSLGYTGLAADIYWTRAVQYFGAQHVRRAKDYKLLYPLLDLTATLDPKLLVAYEFGSFFLAQQPPQGAGTPDLAAQLVERGIKANPSAWRLFYHLGFIQAIERKDYHAAADAFERGSEVPGALPWMKVMAAVMRNRGGERESARILWTKIYENSDDPSIRRNALTRLIALRVDDDITALQQVVNRYHAQTGQAPRTWQQLIEARLLPAIPQDPSGDSYDLENGIVYIHNPAQFPFVTLGVRNGERSPDVVLQPPR